MMTQATHEFVNPEQCGKFPSLTDPDAEVYTVAELLARHERGQLTNLNIGKDKAYPDQRFLTFDSVDLEKVMNAEPVDRFHMANEMERDPAYQDALRKKKEEDEKATQEAAEAAFQAEAAKRGYKRGDEGGEKSPT